MKITLMPYLAKSQLRFCCVYDLAIFRFLVAQIGCNGSYTCCFL